MNLSIKQTRIVTVPVTTLRACMDMACVATILDADGVVVGQSSTPAWMPEVLQIDLESGRIVNWRAPTVEQLQAMADATAADTCIDDMGIANFQKECQRIAKLAEVADEQNTPYGYFDDERDPALLAAVSTVAVESAPKGHQIDIEDAIAASQPVRGVIETLMQIEDAIAADTTEPNALNEPTNTDTARPVGLSTHWSSTHFIADLTAANNKQDIGDAAFYLYARLGLVTGIKPVLANGSGGIKGECINLTDQGHALLGSLMLQKTRLNADKWLNEIIEKNADGELIINQQLPSFHVEKPELAEAAPDQAPASQSMQTVPISGRSAVKPRYHNATTGETWTGRGKQPMWLQTAIAEGAALADFLIPSAVLKKPLEIDDAPATYADICAAIEYASTTLQAAALINRINAHQDYEQRNALHTALHNRITVIKAAEST